MNDNISYFMIREIISSFLQKDLFLEENDVINYLLMELKKNKVTENLDKMNLDFNIVYILLDLLDSLGFLTRKIEMNQKYLTWKGLKGFKLKFQDILSLLFRKHAEIPSIHTPTPTSSAPLSTPAIEIFLKGFFTKLFTNPSIITFS
jgi:hypothetical protein